MRPAHRGSYRPRGITARQVEVLRARFRCGSRKEAAASLGICEETARGHVTALCRALGVGNVMEAAYTLWLRDLWGEG